MDYFTNTTYLTLDGYLELEKYRYIYFFMTFTAYLLIISCNSTVIIVIYTNKHLHEPMYIFIAALLLNALFGTTAFYPKLLIDILSEKQTSSYSACLLQGFVIYWFGASEFTLLSAMAYDRYVSICKPLQYATLVRIYTVKKLLFLSWFLPCCEFSCALILMSQSKLCRFSLNKIYCGSYAIIKLSCKDPTVYNLYGLFIFSIAVFPPFLFVIYSYIRILSVCLKNSKTFRRKALQTCLPHLIIFLNFSVNVCFEVINARLDSNRLPHIIVMIMSIEYLLIPPVFNPIVYGLKLKEIEKILRRQMCCKRLGQVSF